MKRIILLLLFCCTLSACVPALVVGGATAGGAIIYNKRSIKTMLNDRNVTSESRTRIAVDPKLKADTRIGIATYNGIVLMVGSAKTEEAKAQAQQIVSELSHVRRVYNEVTVGLPPSRRTRLRSALITTQVRTAMLVKPGLRSTQMKVVTDNRVVYLMGWVSHSQGKLAADVARRIPGVTKVVKVFEYED